MFKDTYPPLSCHAMYGVKMLMGVFDGRKYIVNKYLEY